MPTLDRAPQLRPAPRAKDLRKRRVERPVTRSIARHKALQRTTPVPDPKVLVPHSQEKRIVLHLPSLPEALLMRRDKRIAEAKRIAAACQDMYAQAKAQVLEADAREAHVTYGLMCPPACVCKFRFIDVFDNASFFGAPSPSDALSFEPQDPYFGLGSEACSVYDSFVANKRVRIE